MELKQLKYFAKIAQVGSVNKAAEELYISQPTMSKTLHALETKLGAKLFIRTSKGMQLTAQGRVLLEYAQNALKNVDMMYQVVRHPGDNMAFSVSSYPSRMIAQAFSRVVAKYQDAQAHLEYHEADTETIIGHVDGRQSELGIVHVLAHQMPSFGRLLAHKKLRFVCLSKRDTCIYVGKHNRLYNRESVRVEELSGMKFAQYKQGYFALAPELEPFDDVERHLGAVQQAVYTDSSHALIACLQNTSLCNFGMHFISDSLMARGLRAVPIEGEQQKLYLGYIQKADEVLSIPAQELTRQVEQGIAEMDAMA